MHTYIMSQMLSVACSVLRFAIFRRRLAGQLWVQSQPWPPYPWLQPCSCRGRVRLDVVDVATTAFRSHWWRLCIGCHWRQELFSWIVNGSRTVLAHDVRRRCDREQWLLQKINDNSFVSSNVYSLKTMTRCCVFLGNSEPSEMADGTTRIIGQWSVSRGN